MSVTATITIISWSVKCYTTMCVSINICYRSLFSVCKIYFPVHAYVNPRRQLLCVVLSLVRTQVNTINTNVHTLNNSITTLYIIVVSSLIQPFCYHVRVPSLVSIASFSQSQLLELELETYISALSTVVKNYKYYVI